MENTQVVEKIVADEGYLVGFGIIGFNWEKFCFLIDKNFYLRNLKNCFIF